MMSRTTASNQKSAPASKLAPTTTNSSRSRPPRGSPQSSSKRIPNAPVSVNLAKLPTPIAVILVVLSVLTLLLVLQDNAHKTTDTSVARTAGPSTTEPADSVSAGEPAPVTKSPTEAPTTKPAKTRGFQSPKRYAILGIASACLILVLVTWSTHGEHRRPTRDDPILQEIRRQKQRQNDDELAKIRRAMDAWKRGDHAAGDRIFFG